ncbi:hypothetical protein FNJ60_14850 [Bacteroides pyogenes]|uniref:Uncharacterized protein n=1 Tax=Bacteroides pyogenes TaxID=310300 RepID=A0A5D3E9C4_9BACE|nr:hypothetical protein FNJ60_14850 [Bacteroides pyogenes]TYK43582.1 hypothetical protein FNG97_13960 [Bacteroides pyogenes]
MLKDTKSLGNNKAPACESRGFVHKKRGVHFDTPPTKMSLIWLFYIYSLQSVTFRSVHISFDTHSIF